MKKVIHSKYKDKASNLEEIIKNFEVTGDEFIKQSRNTLKVFKIDGMKFNVKSFKTPNLINQLAYKYLRPGKAKRSYEYACLLLEKGIGTAHPIAYFEDSRGPLFKESYYVSEHLDYDLTYRELIHNLDYPEHEEILRSFTRFTYQLHEKNVQFLDHSPGNTLIVKTKNGYKFFLVDLNRMKFKSLSFPERMKNFARLTPLKAMVEVMSDEYAKCIGESYDNVFRAMWGETQKFRSKFERKKIIKKALLNR